MKAKKELRNVPNSAGVGAVVNDKPLSQAEQWDSNSTPIVADAESTSQTVQTTHGGAEMPTQQGTYGPQLADNLPDLRRLMYPSPNPFAYGNQPLSILEDTQMISSEPQFPFLGTTTAFGISSNETGAHGVPLYNLGNTLLDHSGQPVIYQQIPNGPALRPSPNRVDYQFPPASGVQDMRNVNGDEELWQQVSKGRTGRTPGLNLDELFGSDGGWSAGYMDQGFSRTQ
jgi:hypothetical protein